uniref:Galectin n=1 Tax=Meloidogyne hapla TaxID=6305 RepID=A0A1I8B6Q2_MELHA
MPRLQHRRNIKILKSYGTIVCFEGYVPNAKDVSSKDFHFRIRLTHDAKIKNNTEKEYYNISVNGGDYIHYPHKFPAWAINRVTGSIQKVFFDNHDGKSEKCQNLTENLRKFELDNNTKRVERELNSKSEVTIKGRIPAPFNETIKINYLHAAIKWNETLGNTVFQMNITKNNCCIDSYTNGKWIKLSQNKIKCFNHNELKEDEKIKLILTFENSLLSYSLETKENVAENSVFLDIPIYLTQYIHVNYMRALILDKLRQSGRASKWAASKWARVKVGCVKVGARQSGLRQSGRGKVGCVKVACSLN